MSNPVNPLNSFYSYSVKHILVAFQYTEDAEQTNITPTLGIPGTAITGSAVGGMGIVVANDFNFSDFSVNSVKWSWDFYGPLTPTTTSCIGYIEFLDRVGMYFIDFMATKVINPLGISEGHIVFALRTFFVGTGYTTQSNAVLVGNPLLFNMVTSVSDLSSKQGRYYMMSFVGASTTFGQLNQYSKLYQHTITHADGNLEAQSPIPSVAGCSLLSRQNEDSMQSTARKTRIDESKPMKTLEDIFNGFAAELNQQKFPNAAQLESWLGYVNNDYSAKITPPVQEKVGGLPVDFFVTLDPIYNSYPVDNRNIPFEQPEQDQRKQGIRSITIKTGMDIPIAVEKLMKLSRQVGQDAALVQPYTFKTSISMVRTQTGRYQVYVVINRIQVPQNGMQENTGPGDAITPLQFTYQNPATNDRDIVSLKTKTATDTGLGVLEQQTNLPNSLVVYGDREQITAERIPSVSYFNSQYSGLRAMINPYENYGLEGGTDAAAVDDVINVDLKQQTRYSIVINGNPYLMFDLNRLPSDVANGNVGNPHYYQFPEFQPMYSKLTIWLATYAVNGITQDPNVANQFYFSNWMFLYRVTNIFESGKFLQQLDMLRMDGQV